VEFGLEMPCDRLMLETPDCVCRKRVKYTLLIHFTACWFIWPGLREVVCLRGSGEGNRISVSLRG